MASTTSATHCSTSLCYMRGLYDRGLTSCRADAPQTTVARAACHNGSGHQVGTVSLPIAHRTFTLPREPCNRSSQTVAGAGPPDTTDRNTGGRHYGSTSPDQGRHRTCPTASTHGYACWPLDPRHVSPPSKATPASFGR